MMYLACILVAVLLGAAFVYWLTASVVADDIWSISIYAGNNPCALDPHPSTRGQPVLTAKDVTDAVALFVADPFLIRNQQRWLLFFEFWNVATQHGEIAYASSLDGASWQYEKAILAEPFHMSYPHVIEHRSRYFMIPETAQAGSVRLYEAREFPHDWIFVAELLRGNFLDASLVRVDNTWWLFALENNRHLTLHHATELTGPWIPHPQNPVISDPCLVRPGGRIIWLNQRLVRFSQNGAKTYGHHVTASEIIELTPTAYREVVISGRPVVGASGIGWNADGMHHVDAHQLDCGSWLAAVDGKMLKKRFDWRAGGGALLKRVGLRSARRRGAAPTEPL